MPHDRIKVITSLEASHRPFAVGDPENIRALHAAEERHFWHRTRNELIAHRLARLGVDSPARFAELGCGSGCVTAHLSRLGYEVVGVDGHPRLLEEAARRAPRARFWVHDLRLGSEPLPERDFDGVGMFDVIEHLDDPALGLSAARDLTKPGGLVVGTVPALPALWSHVDDRAGHRIRFVQSTLHSLLRKVDDVEVLEVVPFNRFLVPMLWLQRRWISRRERGVALSRANLSVPPAPLNHALATLLRLEHNHVGRWLPKRLEGASLWFALRRKKAVPRGGVEPPT